MQRYQSPPFGEERLVFAALESIPAGGASAEEPQHLNSAEMGGDPEEGPGGRAMLNHMERRSARMKRAELAREIEAFESAKAFDSLHTSGLSVSRSPETAQGQLTGSITDAAMILLQRSGLLAPGQGLGKLERRLGIEGQFINYTALGNTLFVEAIDGEGMAKKLVIPMGRFAESRRRQGSESRDQSFAGQLTARLRAVPATIRNILNRPADFLSGINRDGQLMTTYPTVEIGAVCNGSRDYRSVASMRIKRDGPLPGLLRRAMANQVSLKLTRKDIESPIEAKKGGKTIGVCTASINDRDHWERHLAILLEKALRPDDEPTSGA